MVELKANARARGQSKYNGFAKFVEMGSSRLMTLNEVDKCFRDYR